MSKRAKDVPKLLESFADAALEQVELNRDDFLREVLVELARALEGVVGEPGLEAFMAQIGEAVGKRLSRDYRAALGVDALDVDQIAAVLVDLKQRIVAGFAVESIEDGVITLVNTTCPFGDHVVGHPALCAMTKHMFGRIAADSAGYARVSVDESIARGGGGCRVTVSLRSDGDMKDGAREFVSAERVN